MESPGVAPPLAYDLWLRNRSQWGSNSAVQGFHFVPQRRRGRRSSASYGWYKRRNERFGCASVDQLFDRLKAAPRAVSRNLPGRRTGAPTYVTTPASRLAIHSVKAVEAWDTRPADLPKRRMPPRLHDRATTVRRHGPAPSVGIRRRLP